MNLVERHEAPFVGRYAELVAVHDILRQETGRGTVVVLAGGRGMGKTRFLDRVADLAKQRAAIVERAYGSTLLASDGDWQNRFRRASRQWIVCTVDDLHAATPRDLEIFLRLRELSAQLRLLLVVSYLEDNSSLAEETIASISRALDGGALSFRLKPIDRADAQTIVEAHCARYNLEVEAQMKSGILEMAAGNPGLLHELLGEFRAGTLDKYLVPSSIHGRLSHLRQLMPLEGFRILQIAAVVGRRFHSDWLLELADAPLDRVAGALQLARDLNVISEDSEDANYLVFAHPVMHRAIYSSVIALQRRQLHALMASRLGELTFNAGVASLEYESLLGSHLVSAGSANLGAPHLIRAADAAYAKGDPELAVRLYLEALLYVDEAFPDWQHVQKRVFRCYGLANDWKASIPHLQALKSFYAAARNVPGQLWALARLIEVYDNLDDFAAAQGTFAEFHEIASSLDVTHDVLDGYTVWARSLWSSGRGSEARNVIRSISEKSTNMSEKLTDFAKSYVPALVARAILFSRDQPVEATFSLIEEAAHLATATNVSMCDAYLHASETAWELGYSQRALDYNERARIGASRSRNQSVEQMASIISMQIALDLGRLQTCREHALLLPSGRCCWEMPIASVVTLVGIRMGERTLVDDFFRPELLKASMTSKSCQWTSALVRGFAEAMVSRGLQKELSELLHVALSLKEILDPRLSIPLAVAQYGSRADFARARARITACTRGPGEAVATASLALFDTMVAARTGRASKAQIAAKRAVSLFEELGWPLMVAKALEASGRVIEAQERYRACHAWGDVARLCSGADSKGRSRGSPLTKREADVKRLLARAMSNREIAVSLCISERTTAHHVEAVLGKLGLRSRWQLAE